jgi:hypothetical protein
LRPFQSKLRDNTQPNLQSTQTFNHEERYILRLLTDTKNINLQSHHNLQNLEDVYHTSQTLLPVFSQKFITWNYEDKRRGIIIENQRLAAAITEGKNKFP